MAASVSAMAIESPHGVPISTSLGSQSFGPRLPRVEERVVLRVGPAGVRLGDRARAAQVRVLGARRVLEERELLRERDRLENALVGVRVEQLVVGEDVRVRRLDARVVAARVVVRGDLAELREPAEQVGHVGPRDRDEVLRGVERGDRRREGRVAALLELRQVLEDVVEVVRAARAQQRQAQVLEHRHRLAGDRPHVGEERREVPRADERRRDERVEVVERGAQVDEGRVGLAEERRQRDQGAVEGLVLRPRSPPSASFPFATKPERSSRREAIAVTTLEPSTRKSSKTWLSRVSSASTFCVELMPGLRYL